MTRVSTPQIEAVNDDARIIGLPVADDALAYHWSPTTRRESIQAHGLRIRQASTHAPVRYPMICLCLDPLDAWSMSAGTFVTDEPAWDLWGVRTGDLRHGFEVIPTDDRRIRELRVYRSIPAAAVRYIATREA